MNRYSKLILLLFSMFMFFACSDDNPTDSTPVTSSDFEYSGDLRSFATVTFKSNSVNADVYLWEFGDGTTSALANPTKVYETAGDYNVKLTAESSTTGQKDIREKSITINPGKVYITKISVVKLPFTDSNSAGWDLSSGPDLFFILKKANLVVVDASANYISDVVESMLPAYWTFTSPYQIDDWAGEHYFELYDWDASGDDYIGKTESFKINNVILEGYENNISVTSSDGKIEFVVDVLWK